MENNNMLAMILAGGRGSRLYELTSKTAKPAVFFGGKYRIIDFPLSNCANSNVNVVGVLTQYEPVQLNAYAGAGQRWGLDARGSGVYVLPPSQRDGAKFGVYDGTADAINQNIDFIDQFNPRYVLILSGDHIYKMDYDKMLDAHKNMDADLTVAVRPVSWEEAPRFGIMNCDSEGRIEEFQEKPAHPKSNLASMGIYIFDWPLLRQTLIEDAADTASSHDFGNDIIPKLLAQNKRLYAYSFKGYWKDVGTIDSLWEANMDLIDHNDELDLGDKSWKIYTADIPVLPHYVSKTGRVEHCYINQGAVIHGVAMDSVLFNNVTIERGAEVHSSVLMPGTIVRSGARVNRCVIGENVEIGRNAVVGQPGDGKIELICENVEEVK